MQHEKHAKSVRRQKKMPPAIIPEKAIILHTLEDAGIVTHRDRYSATSFQHEVKQRSIEKLHDE